jgi:hypothetical protein
MSKWTSSSRRRILPGRSDVRLRPSGYGGQAGIALPGVLVLSAVLVGVSGWLVGHLRVETALAFELEEAHVASRVAEAALQAAALALGQAPDWTIVGGLGAGLVCPASGLAVVAIDEASERSWLQAETDAGSRWGADSPRWQTLWSCHGPGVLARWPHRHQAPGVVVWVADDPEGDGRPDRDTNQRLVLAAVARGREGVRASARAAIARSSPGAGVRLLAWQVEPGA